MSGGALDYGYQKVRYIAEELARQATRLEHRALVKHLLNVSLALHDTEWVLSGDYAEGDELEAIARVLGSGAMLEKAVDEARAAKEQLEQALAKVEDK